MSHIRFRVASSCMCMPVSMLRRRITFKCCHRPWTVCWLSSDKTSTTKRSGDEEAGFGACEASIGECYVDPKHAILVTSPSSVCMRCCFLHEGNSPKGAGLFPEVGCQPVTFQCKKNSSAARELLFPVPDGYVSS